MKIIPAIDVMDGKVVRLYRGDANQKTIYSDNPIAVALKWEKCGADMLHLVDLDATLGRGSNTSILCDIADIVKIPVEVAGGLRTESIAADAAGFADRIVIGTMAFQDKHALDMLASDIGKARIVISADHIDGKIVIHGWQSDTKIDMLDAVEQFVSDGYTEFLLTDVSRDGTMDGPDLEYLAKVCSINGANVIASGGISGICDVQKVREKNAFGVILGKALYEGNISIKEARGSA
ncbi:MAG: 1-(5-phosphoribosyl)-5-[(5-phosphoribosylamino)methylideneamino] imidazole-4-carboxamide isomerase [Thaumarchaeota archaeon]|nr:1-(5-phosphoribosyl)-5-[(5-phosphoribosylamino)methylideneamino] imidazole-4-carboxamide isomerase [Nitrososphaerota archaeon]